MEEEEHLKTLNIIALATTLVALLLFSGCSSFEPYRPYSRSEKMWFSQAVIGQSLDALSTSWALDRGGEEQNPLWHNPEDTGSLVAGKAAILGAAYVYGLYFPDSRKTLYKVLAVGGYGAAAWNTYQGAK